MLINWLKRVSVQSRIIFAIALLFHQDFAFAGKTTNISELNGLQIAASSASHEWLRQRNKGQSQWVNQLANDQDGSLECPICFESLLEKRTLVVSQCGHLLCETCSIESSRDPVQKNACPMCRSEHWRDQMVLVDYFSAGAHDLAVKVGGLDSFTENFSEVAFDPQLGVGLTDVSGLTWYEAVKVKKYVFSGCTFRRMQSGQVRLMYLDQAEAYCKKRNARLPTEEEFDVLRQSMYFLDSPSLYDSTPALADMSRNEFWSSARVPKNSSEDTSEYSPKAYCFSGIDGRMKRQIISSFKAAVLCVR